MTPEAAYRKAARRLKAKYILGYLAFVCLIGFTGALILLAAGVTGNRLPGYTATPANRELLGVTFWGTLMAGLVLTIILGPVLAAARFFAHHIDGNLHPEEADEEHHGGGHANPRARQSPEACPEEQRAADTERVQPDAKHQERRPPTHATTPKRRRKP